jgi:hypothetical protein
MLEGGQMPIITNDQADWFRDYISECFWKPSKQKATHSYTVREWRPKADSDFVKAVETIRTYGHPENFFLKIYIYLHMDGYKYWTMGDLIDNTIIINRAPSSNFYGEQKAPIVNRTYDETIYDRLAPQYDKRYSDPLYLLENTELFERLQPYLIGSVLDVGCGTGLFLDYITWPRGYYVGIDPSQGMMNEFLRKHPYQTFFQVPFEKYADDWSQTFPFDTSISLFGAASYVRDTHYQALLESGINYFFMFYKENYLPDYYELPDQVITNYKKIKEIFPTTGIYNNYLVATNMEIFNDSI